MSRDAGCFSDYTRRVFIAAAVFALTGVVLLFAWEVSQVLLVVFAATLLAILLDSLAVKTARRLRMPRPWALILVVLVLLVLGGTAIWAMGPQVGAQFSQIQERLPEALEDIRGLAERQDWTRSLYESISVNREWIPSGTDILGRISGVFSTALGAIANLFIIVLIGFYLAISPNEYLGAILRLLPLRNRARGRVVLESLGQVLRWWLVGRIAAMTAVGLLTTIGLWLIGMPLALGLGVIAGLLSFVPYFGPVVSAIPALLIAIVESPLAPLYVLLVYVGVQFLEGNFITPLIQRQAVSLPPAVLLTAQLLGGVTFGLLGILLATPLAVALIVLIQMVYIEGVLGDRVPLLGQHHVHNSGSE